ncbi:MAG: fused MFS/spermidine synthase [Pseudohongiellaceae bacterium]
MIKLNLNNSLILGLAFTSGFIIMSIELLGGRILAPYFGSSIYVWGSIITVFMLSLSVGYLTGGRLSLHNPSLKRHAGFFILGGIAILPIILWANEVMETVFIAVEDPRYGSLIVSMLLFFIPTVILGMISPYSVRLLVIDSHHSGNVAGSLYFVSTLGSALGTLGTSFYLVLWFEVNQILMVMSGALLLAGMAAILGYYRLPMAMGQPDQKITGELS